jgi:hypothetical protein
MLGNVMLRTAGENERGFDTAAVVTPAVALRMKQAGYQFVMRYIRRDPAHAYDLTIAEATGILDAGLGLMLVQHVAPDNWHPTAVLGSQYGHTAAQEASKLGYPAGGIVWCDLEMVAHGTAPSLIIGYCNSWFSEVEAAGYEPGLYVGYGCGLTAQQLYKNLRFRRYCSGYNLDQDQIPAVRGVQMQQRAYPGIRAVPGVPFSYDVDVCMADHLGSWVVIVERGSLT